MTNISLEFDWLPVLSSEHQPYSFPDRISRFFRDNFSGPAIYRWSVHFDGIPKKVYFGEAENLARRIEGYRRGNSGQKTNARIKALFVELRESGHKISLHSLEFAPFMLNGSLIDKRANNKKEVRCFLECALTILVPADVELLNKTASVESKAIEKVQTIFKSLSPPEKERFIATLKSESLVEK